MGSMRACPLFHGNILYKYSSASEGLFTSAWKVHILLPRKQSVRAKNTGVWMPITKAVATVETKIVQCDNGENHDYILPFDYNLELLESQFPHEDSPETNEKERLRRMKISKANKGNVPWNKGRKHSAETLLRIRERTKLAMQDPKVKMKLMNLGHAQSEETKVKIGVGVRMRWRRRHERLMVQEICCMEWQNLIAEASRKGISGEEELHWDSYKILDKCLRQEWLESVERRKTMPRPKGSKRAPKSPEQRRKISMAISAKWNDPGYRDRVCSALAKYHGTTIGTARKTKKTREDASSMKRRSSKKKATEPYVPKTSARTLGKIAPRERKGVKPSFKDPMADSKLEMIKNIRIQRAAMEATQRAKSLIDEAEKAAKTLEIAALSNPLARASLLETRRLIAEATRSIEGIQSRSGTSSTLQNGSPDTNTMLNSLPTNVATHAESGSSPNLKIINGTSHLYMESKDSPVAFHFDDFGEQNVRSGKDKLQLIQSSESNTEDALRSDDFSLPSENVMLTQSQLKTPKRSNTSAPIPKKKWVCGRLVEVEGD